MARFRSITAAELPPETDFFVSRGGEDYEAWRATRAGTVPEQSPPDQPQETLPAQRVDIGDVLMRMPNGNADPWYTLVMPPDEFDAMGFRNDEAVPGAGGAANEPRPPSRIAALFVPARGV